MEEIEIILVNLEDEGRNVLFIHEIHRLPMHVEEALYSVMEDFMFEKKLVLVELKKLCNFGFRNLH